MLGSTGAGIDDFANIAEFLAMIIANILAAVFLAEACPAVDPRTAMLAVHEIARQAHLSGDAKLIGSTMADPLVLADGGKVRE